MKRLLVLTAVLLGVSALASGAEPGKEDARNIQGTWTVTIMEENGTKLPPPRETKVTFGADKFELTSLRGDLKYKLGTEKGIGTIDVTTVKGGKTFISGLYELKGDELKLCFGTVPGAPRPGEFTSQGGNRIWHLKRVSEK